MGVKRQSSHKGQGQEPKHPAELAVDRVKAWVAARILRELEDTERGADAKMARRVGISTAHLANLKSQKSYVDLVGLFKFASYWGMSPGQLIGLAMGAGPSLELVVGSSRVHPMIARMAATHEFTETEAESASLLVKHVNTEAMPEDVALDLLRRARQSIADASRYTTERISDLPDSSVRRPPRRRR